MVSLDFIGEHRGPFWVFVLAFIFGTVEAALHGAGWQSWIPGLFIGVVAGAAVYMGLAKLRGDA